MRRKSLGEQNNQFNVEVAMELARFYDDPYGYVMWAFPWGEGILTGHEGPREWQEEYLHELGRLIKARQFDGVNPVLPIQKSITSGHGIGKSALTAWLIKFISDTRPYSKGVVTANTGDQLKTKTWSELGKWHKLSMTRDYFTHNNTKGNMTFYHKQFADEWRCDAMTCREENSESFAGLHCVNSTPYYIFDEASAIPEKIFEVAQGGLTDGEPMFLMFGNPTRNTGFFRQTFGKLRNAWQQKQINSELVEGTNKELFKEWEKLYGRDSDFYKVRVLGQFPKASVLQLIPTDIVEAAMGKHLEPHQYHFAPKVIGVDVAWYGDDRNTVYLRQGLASKLLWEGIETDSIDIAGIVAQHFDREQADAIFVDAGMGNGVIDQLRRLGYDPIPVYFGGKSLREDCADKRTEMWANKRDWFKLYSAIPDNEDLKDDLVGPEYFMDAKGRMRLESKKDMKKRGLASPDHGDGLALTFAQPVYKKKPIDEYRTYTESNTVEKDYDVFSRK